MEEGHSVGAPSGLQGTRQRKWSEKPPGGVFPSLGVRGFLGRASPEPYEAKVVTR